MKAIFLQNCEVWKIKACPNEDLRNLHEKHEKQILEGEKLKNPEEGELKRLNEICSKCIHALQIDEAVCPICGSDNLTRPRFDSIKPWIEIYFYYCKKCGRNLYSDKKFY